MYNDIHTQQTQGTHVMRLKELVKKYGGTAIVITDAGNGCAYDERGQLEAYDEDIEKQYGSIIMYPLVVEHESASGNICRYTSDWIVEGTGDNPYRVKILF